MSEIASNDWPLRGLGDCGIRVLDCEHKTPKDAGTGHPYIAIPNLVNGRVDLSTVRRISEDDLAEWTRRTKPEGGDIVVTRRGRVGDTAVIPSGERCAIGQNLVILRSEGTHVDQRFLRWAVRGPLWWSEVNRLRNVGAVFDSLNVRDIPRLRICVPPPVNQRDIADVLDALDDKIESNRRVAEAADRAWIAYAQHALRGAKRVAVADLISDKILLVNDGYRAKNAELAGEGLPFVRAGNLTSDGLDFTDADRVPAELAAKVGVKRSLPLDTAFTSKGTVGRITLVDTDTEPFVYSPQVCFWRSACPDRLSPLVLHAWMRGPAFTAQVNSVKGQTDMADYVSLRDQRAMYIDVPELAAQRDADALAAPLAKLAAATRREVRKLVAIRDALLPKLLSGQIRVKSLDDVREPAIAV